MWQTFGHAAVKQLLDKQLERGQFPHAYLFTGPLGLGKQALAAEMAQKILKTEKLASHADYIYYDAADGAGMEGLRQFLGRLGSKPFIGQYKVAIIDNMDQANTQMGNALLKTLEEPSPSTILFLISARHGLLPTIVSRCQTLAFNPLALDELKQYATERGLKIDNDEVLMASFGSPGRLQALLNDKELADQINQGVAQLETAQHSGTAERLLAVSALAELELEPLRDILLAWLYQQRQALARQPERYRLVAGVCEALEHLNGSFNKKMVLQRLLLQSYETA